MTTLPFLLRTCCAAVLLAGAASCTDDDQTVRERLTADTAAFELQPDSALVSMEVGRWDGLIWRSSRVGFDLTSGDIALLIGPTGHVILDRAELRFADVAIPDSPTSSANVELSNVHLRTAVPHECDSEDWSTDDQSCIVNVPTALRLEFELRAAAPERRDRVSLREADVDVQVSFGDEQVGLSASLAAIQSGTLWAWGNLTFGDLMLYGDARERTD